MKLFRRRRADIPAISWIESAAALPRATLEGRSRALIENHTGIVEFSCERLRLSSRLGEISVTGAELELARVCPGSLMVLGRIDGVTMPEGGSCDGC